MHTQPEAWIVDDDESIRWVLKRALADDGIAVRAFDNAAAARAALDDAQPDALVSDVRMPGEDGMRLLAYLRERHPDLPVIIMTAYTDLDSAVAAYAGGAFDYLPKPFDVDAAVTLVRRALEHGSATRRSDAVHRERVVPGNAQEIIGDASAMQEVFRAIGRLKHSAVTVLIGGESGTGKELLARALHRHGPRAGRPLVSLNTAAIPAELVESELFGHEKGAFTGAHTQRVGRFEQADGGTLFLDEIGDMPAAAQTRLLRVLEEGSFHRVGGTRAVEVDVRVIAASNRPLESLVKQGAFREDLYHRLAVVRLRMPPLRERAGDIPALAAHFLDEAAREMSVSPKHASGALLDWMARQPWPGNVRQLKNLCQWLTVMAPGERVHVDDLPSDLRPGTANAVPAWQQHLAAWAEDRLEKGGRDLAGAAQPAFERTLIEAALRHAKGQRGEAAKLLGWGRNTLTRKLKQE